MGNEFKGLTSHSAEWFGDSRDHWWNLDSLAHLAQRWRPEGIRTVLDVGSGVGHWGRTLARVLDAETRFTGVDREPLWVEKATERAESNGLAARFRYRRGSADALDFEDGSFDLVTCQTVLIHVADAARTLREMARVTRPGGLVLLAEPNNAVWPVIESVAAGTAPDEIASLVRFHLVCLRGKAALGEGNDLVGESLPSLLAAAGLEDIEIRMNDRTAPMLPPYDSPAEGVAAEEMIDLADREIIMWARDDTKRRFLAGGGADVEFDALWSTAIAQRHRIATAIREKRYACAGGGLFYVAWARKPNPTR